jgi:hypothetical protein
MELEVLIKALLGFRVDPMQGLLEFSVLVKAINARIPVTHALLHQKPDSISAERNSASYRSS